MRSAWFVISDNNNLHKIELSKTLLHFIEFDFTYFWEQCIEAGKNARKTGRLPQSQLSIAKNAIVKCHPYVDACIYMDFDSIAIDCIIEYICKSENIGLEELWARCISPKNLYERAIFKRISEYKTNRAINQWVNIVRMRDYAKQKLEFIFDSEDGKVEADDIYRTRKEYFDLAFSVAANETGMPTNELPYVKVYNPALMPEASFMMSKVSKAIYRRISDKMANVDFPIYKGINDQMRDRMALDAFSYVKNLSRPAENEMKLAVEAVKDFPETIYLPSSFKAIIDLEFDLMFEDKLYFRKCSMCKRYYVDESSYDKPYCSRINSSGKTCRQTFEEHNAEKTADDSLSEKKIVVAESIPVDLEKRCQKIYNSLYKKVGKIMDDQEFKEWSQYLSNMKRNIKIGEATLDVLVDFLGYSEKMYGEVKSVGRPKNQKYRTETEMQSGELFNNYIKQDKEAKQNAVENSETEQDVQTTVIDKTDETKQKSVTVVKASENSKLKPFVPESFDTLYDAVMSSWAKEADENNEDDSHEEEERPKKREIRLPQWEVIKRDVK